MMRSQQAIFDEAFVTRVARARLNAGLTQREVASQLGITDAQWADYETHSPFPHSLSKAFCRLVELSYEELYAVPTYEQAKAGVERPDLAPSK